MWASTKDVQVGEVDIVIQGVLEKKGQFLSQWLPRRLYLTTSGGLYSTRDLEYTGLFVRSRQVPAGIRTFVIWKKESIALYAKEKKKKEDATDTSC